MWHSIRGLDRILRGDVTRPEAVRGHTIDVSLLSLSVVVLVLAMIYGACMGSFSLFKEIDPSVVDPGDRLLQRLRLANRRLAGNLLNLNERDD